MKNFILCLLLLVVGFGVTGCKKTAQVDPTDNSIDNPLKFHTQELQQAQLWLPGKWKLVKVIAFAPKAPVPKVELIIDENQISLIKDGVQTDKVGYEIIKDQGLHIKTTTQPSRDNWYIRNPTTLYINEKRMFFDLGRLQDDPGYEFARIN